MYDATEFFKDRKVDIQKLVSFGFFRERRGYIYQQPILGGMFVLCVLVEGNSVDGKFIGKIRMEYEQILINIRDKCFAPHVFKTQLAEDVINFAYERFGDKLEFLWDKLPIAAILRHKVSRKWYAIFMKIPAQRLGIDDKNHIEILNLKVKSENIAKIVDKIKFFPAYHMNKNNWVTVNLNKIEHLSEIIPLILESYSLVS